MAGTPPTITATQDLHLRTHLLPQTATSWNLSTKEQTSTIGPSFKARSSNASWPRTSRTSMTKKKLQEEACLPHQQCISRHQHSTNRRKIKKRDRDNRSCWMNPERRRRISSKSIGTYSPKISRKEWQPSTTSSTNQSSQI